MSLEKKIEDRSARVCVLGMGYVGLPLALEFVRAGFHVTGVDVARDKIDALNSGRSHVEDVPDAVVRKALDDEKISFIPDLREGGDVDVVLICVPTPLRKTRDPDISYIVAALERIAEKIRPGMLVVLESTTYPGTTEEILRPKLEAGGLKAGKDFHLAFSPERVDPGNKKYDTHNTPKVVGGTTAECTRVAAALYSTAVASVVPVTSTQSAEMVKLLENTFRAVNIGLVNEITLMCQRLGINVWEVIEAAASKPFGFMPFYPGPGIGGHCIPLDPHYLSWKLKTLNYYAKFIELASEINASMPEHVVSEVTSLLNDCEKAVRSSRLLILGVAYKRDTSDVRESPALDLMRLLDVRGARVDYSDPLVPTLRSGERTLESVELTPENIRMYDAVVVVTDHTGVDYQKVLDHAQALFDSRNVTGRLEAGDCLVRRL